MGDLETGYSQIFTASGPGPEGTMVRGKRISEEMARKRRVFIGEVYGFQGRATETEAALRAGEGGDRGAPVYRAGDYFDFDEMTIIQAIPTQ